MGKLGETRGGVGKSGVLEQKSGNISETRKDMETLLWRAYRKSQTFFRTVPSPTTYSLPSPRLGVRNPTPKLQSLIAIISGTGKATNFQFCTHILSINRNKSPLQISGKLAVSYSQHS